MFSLNVNTKKVTNGHDLPKTPEAGLLFYEMVITQHDFAHPIVRATFHPDKGPDLIKVELWRHDVEIPVENAIENNMTGYVARYESLPIEIHFYKVMEDVDEDGGPLLEGLVYKRHIYEGTSAVQDVASFRIKKEGKITNKPRYMESAVYVENASKKLDALDEVPLTKTKWGSSRRWLTQRHFYGTTNVTSSNPIHKENLERAINKFLKRYKNKKFDSLKSLLVEYGKTLQVGRLKYESDTVFAENGIPGDAGDALIELTSKGDCEDFGHFYMRTIRTLTKIYKYVLPDSSADLYKKCQMLEKEYMAFNFICRVLVSGEKEFHSTMLIVPRKSTKEHPVISFEVTDPDKSYSLPDKEFDKWHVEHYFILDSICIHRLNRVTNPKSVDLHKLSGENLFPYNY